MSNYAWIIDIDHIEADTPQRSGEIGPRDADATQIAQLQDASEATAGGTRSFSFRMYDDDGILYYSGRIIFSDPTVDPDTADDDAAFGPLNDYGTPGAGAVRIDYLRDGEWITL